MPIIRDEALEQRLLTAIIADNNSQQRTRQRLLGPSQIGQCRELIRGTLFDEAAVLAERTHWPVAAHFGTVMGADLERIFGERLDALTQQRITATFPDLGGVAISGATDIIFLNDEHISDIKTVDDMGSVLSDLEADARRIEILLGVKGRGELYRAYEPIIRRDGTELLDADGSAVLKEVTEDHVKWMARLSNYVQIAIYVVGAIQLGILPPTATGRLLFVDRTGDYLGIVALVIPQEWIDLFFAIAQHRLRQVLEAQELLERTGNPALIHHLRDKSPSWCFSPKVLCERRELCWGGSELAPVEEIVDPEYVRAIGHYIEGRRLEKLGSGMKSAAKAALNGDGRGNDRVSGRTEDGRMVSWDARGYINVVETVTATDKEEK